jgi:hypothetical protein
MSKPRTHCEKMMMGVEYGYPDPYRYDGVSEWRCTVCSYREGRWTGRELKEGEQEPPYGNKKYITSEMRHYNL